MGKAIRDIYGEYLKEKGKTDERIVVLDADVSGSTKSAIFGKEFPERFYNCGISEYAMVGMAAGMAKSGKIPFVNTFAVFLTTLGSLAARTFMSYSRINIKMMGAYGGLSDSYDGATHHSLEDIAVMRTLPYVDVMVASDEATTKWMVDYACQTNLPMYIRLSRDAFPQLYTGKETFERGKSGLLREGSDVTIFACGIMVGKAMEAAKELEAEGIKASVVDMYYIKPIDKDRIIEQSKKTKAFVTAEEHSVIGGLGSAVSEVMTEHSCYVPLEKVGVQDCHAESGAYKEILEKYGLDKEHVKEAARKAFNRVKEK